MYDRVATERLQYNMPVTQGHLADCWTEIWRFYCHYTDRSGTDNICIIFISLHVSRVNQYKWQSESTQRLARTIRRGRASSKVLWECGVCIIGKGRIWLHSIISGRQLNIAGSEVRSLVSGGGVCGRKSATGRVLLWGLWCPLPIIPAVLIFSSLSRTNTKGHLDYDKKTTINDEKYWVFSKWKSFAEYIVQYARESSGGWDTVGN